MLSRFLSNKRTLTYACTCNPIIVVKFCFFYFFVSAVEQYRLLQDFDNRHVQYESKTMERTMSINSVYMSIVEQHLKQCAICDHVEMIGSVYEGLATDEADSIQFEALITMPISGSDIEVIKMSDKPFYVWLKFLHGAEPSPVFDRVLNYWSFFGSWLGERYLDSKKTVDLIFKGMEKCIFESKYLNGKVKLNRKGAVLQMEVYPDSWLLSWGSRLYSVDIIPAYTVGQEVYESRPIRGDKMPDTMTWHRSFALQERQKLCEGAKMVLRVLKALRKRESDFGNFTSYQLKTVVLHETDANEDWSELMLGKRLADVLARLERCLAARNIPHYFSPEINLLSKMPPYAMDYLGDRIRHLRTNEDEIVRLLKI